MEAPRRRGRSAPAVVVGAGEHIYSWVGDPAEPRVYVVDDDADNRDLLVEALAQEGIAAEGADSGESALERFRAHPTPVIVTDVRMPGMSGIDLARCVRALDPHVRVIGLSGSVAEDLPAKTFDLIWTKPLDPFTAVAEVQRMLDAPA